MTSSRARFPKPVDLYKGILFFGRNIIASEGDHWKKYRKICAPAFSDVSLLCYGPLELEFRRNHQRNNKLVWDETLQIMRGLFEDVWGDRDVITVDHCVEITLPVSRFPIHGWI